MSNLPIYAAAIANEDVKLPGHADRKALTYSEAIALDTDYAVPDTNTSDYVVDVFIWIGILIVSVTVALVLLYAIVTCWFCRKCKCGGWITMKNEPFEKWNVKKGIYEPNPRQNMEIHHLGKHYHWKEKLGIIKGKPGV